MKITICRDKQYNGRKWISYYYSIGNVFGLIKEDETIRKLLRNKPKPKVGEEMVYNLSAEPIGGKHGKSNI